MIRGDRIPSEHVFQAILGSVASWPVHVREANVMVSRVVLLLILVGALGKFWMLEQPSGSMMVNHPRFQELLGSQKVYKKLIHMKDWPGALAGY